MILRWLSDQVLLKSVPIVIFYGMLQRAPRHKTVYTLQPYKNISLLDF